MQLHFQDTVLPKAMKLPSLKELNSKSLNSISDSDLQPTKTKIKTEKYTQFFFIDICIFPFYHGNNGFEDFFNFGLMVTITFYFSLLKIYSS